MSPNQNKQLIEALNEYNNTNTNGSYESYRDTLFKIFNDTDDAMILTGMMLFVKSEHQSQFDKDIRRKHSE